MLKNATEWLGIDDEDAKKSAEKWQAEEQEASGKERKAAFIIQEATAEIEKLKASKADQAQILLAEQAKQVAERDLIDAQKEKDTITSKKDRSGNVASVVELHSLLERQQNKWYKRGFKPVLKGQIQGMTDDQREHFLSTLMGG